MATVLYEVVTIKVELAARPHVLQVPELTMIAAKACTGMAAVG